MSISVGNKTYNATPIVGGVAGGLVAGTAANKMMGSTLFGAATDTIGASIGGKLDRVPGVAGSFLASNAVRGAGGDATKSALAAYAGKRATELVPEASKALHGVASEATHPAAKLGARVGAAVLDEAPHVAGAVAGAKGAGIVARAGVTGAALLGGVAAGGVLLETVAPSFEISL